MHALFHSSGAPPLLFSCLEKRKAYKNALDTESIARNYWALALCAPSTILKTKEHIFSCFSLRQSLVSGIYIAVIIMTWLLQWLWLALSEGPNRAGVSLSYEDLVQWLRLALSKGPNRVGVSLWHDNLALWLRLDLSEGPNRACVSVSHDNLAL
jgi:hypothetical protein